jgi:starch-binding outer membrane protein, SusD/RagB family
MKTRIISLLFLTFVGLFFVSCEDQLKPQIFSEPTDKNFPKTNEDVNSVLAPFYAIFDAEWGPIDPAVLLTNPNNTDKNAAKMWSAYCCMNGWSQVSSSTTDEMYDDWNKTAQFKWSKNENTFTYNGLYQRVTVVAKATSFIDIFQNQLSELQNKSNKTDLDLVSIALRKRAIGELRCLRGWTMFLLYDWFGAVDVKLDPATLIGSDFVYRPSANPNSEYTKKYLNAMVSDLKCSIPYLYDDIFNATKPDANDAQFQYGHVTQDVARMLLMKHYMNYASATNKTEYWDSAKVFCDALLSKGKDKTNGVYELNKSYSKVFTDIGSTGPSTDNREVIWSTTYGANRPSWHFRTNLPPGCDTVCGIPTDNANWGGYVMPWEFYDNYPAGDTRLLTLADKYHDVNENNGKGAWVKRGTLLALKKILVHGAIAVKWLIKDKQQSTLGQFSVVAFRYADVLLSAAEIENEKNGPTATAKSYLKMITDRSNTSSITDFINGRTGKPVIGAATALSTSDKQVFRDFLLAERGRELYWEGWRRMDLIRFKNAQGVSKYLEYAASVNPSVSISDPRWLLFPLPSKVNIESGGTYEDNPGY